MKNINSIIIAVLGLAVAFLFYDKFSNDTSDANVADENVEENVEIKELKLAYINIDSLNDQYIFIKDQTEVLEKEGARIQANITNKLKKAENRQAELQQQLPSMTQAQYDAAEAEMQKMQYDLQDYQSRQAQVIQDLQQDSQDKIQQQLDSFLTPYKEEYDFIFSYAKGTELMFAKESYEITKQIIQEMNAAYNSESEAK